MTRDELKDLVKACVIDAKIRADVLCSDLSDEIMDAVDHYSDDLIGRIQSMVQND